MMPCTHVLQGKLSRKVELRLLAPSHSPLLDGECATSALLQRTGLYVAAVMVLVYQ